MVELQGMKLAGPTEAAAAPARCALGCLSKAEHFQQPGALDEALYVVPGLQCMAHCSCSSSARHGSLGSPLASLPLPPLPLASLPGRHL